MLTQIDHIQLAMPAEQEQAARDFFIKILGLTEEQKPEPLASRGGCWFRNDYVIIHCGVESDFSPAKKAHPAFTVANLDELADTLLRHDHEVIWDESLPDRKRFYTSDPFGNRIEFMRHNDGFKQK